MTRQEYLTWRNSAPVIGQESDTIVELTNGRFVRIRHRPMEGNGWVATHEDITERHGTEKALAEAKAAAEQAEATARAAHSPPNGGARRGAGGTRRLRQGRPPGALEPAVRRVLAISRDTLCRSGRRSKAS